MSGHSVRVFSTAFKEGIVRRLEAGEALAAVAREAGIARKLLYEWRGAWRRLGVAGLNRKRGPKPGRERILARGDPPGAALASSAPDAAAEAFAPAAELARAKARIEELERKVGRQELDLDFFRKALRLADDFGAETPGVWRDRLYALIRSLSAAQSRKAKPKRSARCRRARTRFSICAGSPRCRGRAIIAISRRTRPGARTPICAIAIHRVALVRPALWLSPDHQAIGARRARRQLQAGAAVDAARQSPQPALQAVRPAHHGQRSRLSGPVRSDARGDAHRAGSHLGRGHHLHAAGGGLRLSGGGHGRVLAQSRGLGARRSSEGSLPIEALDKAIVSRGGSLKDLVHHSDRGVQYACRDYAKRLAESAPTPA